MAVALESAGGGGDIRSRYNSHTSGRRCVGGGGDRRRVVHQVVSHRMHDLLKSGENCFLPSSRSLANWWAKLKMQMSILQLALNESSPGPQLDLELHKLLLNCLALYNNSTSSEICIDEDGPPAISGLCPLSLLKRKNILTSFLFLSNTTRN
ncbi:hypothetical protein O6H91_09G048100 [Diphasiastrum complanatum]|uniref:Uncharacterized protein n=1 Tax=Diphasiastrum complanatum TaxID=34168 RepID=A0ACC2CNW6_DIPCM|nr:hypothetical protein O6H91_09G048100 [Diphasiastrum complanatum]